MGKGAPGTDSIDKQIKELEERISNTAYNKKTQHAIGMYKAKLASLRRKKEEKASSSTGKSEHGWTVKKSGDATVVLLGFPSVGKSSLLNALTNAESEVGMYSFTTLSCIPGDLEYRGAKIQVLDVPGVVQGAAAGTGRGKEVLQVLRTADLIIILVDVFYPDHLRALEREIYNTYVRLNQKTPDVRIKKTTKGGVRMGTTIPLTYLNEDMVRDILKQFRIMNADVLIRDDITVDQFIDVVEGNRVYVPAVRVLNKIDMTTPEEVERVNKMVEPDIQISAATGKNLEELKGMIFEKCELMPIYCKEVGEKADYEEPLILRKGDTVRRMCEKLHKDFVKKFKFARVWGDSAKFPGQKLSLRHVLYPGDVVELHIR